MSETMFIEDADNGTYRIVLTGEKSRREFINTYAELKEGYGLASAKYREEQAKWNGKKNDVDAIERDLTDALKKLSVPQRKLMKDLEAVMPALSMKQRLSPEKDALEAVTISRDFQLMQVIAIESKFPELAAK